MQKKLILMEVLLSAEFALGMITNLFGVLPQEAAEHAQPAFALIASGIHSLLGLALLIGAVFLFTASLKAEAGKLKMLGFLGLLSVLIAFAGGIATVSLKDEAIELASFVMSLGFLFAFYIYGWMLSKLNQKMSAS